MADELVELAAQDVFVLLGVPVPDNIEIRNNLEELDTHDGDEDSKISLTEGELIRFKVMSLFFHNIIYIYINTWTPIGITSD
jgi:hypothetical protein